MTPIILVLLYLLVLAIVVTIWGKSSESSIEEYAVANRSFPWYIAVFTMLGTMYTGFHITGLAGWAAYEGMYAANMVVGGFNFVIIYFIAPRIWRWGKTYKLVNSPEIVEKRFNSYPLSLVQAVFSIMAAFAWYVMAMIIFGNIPTVLSNGQIPAFVGSLVMAVFICWYVFRGGQRSVVVTDFFQGLIAFFVMMAVLYFTAQHFFGGYISMFQRLAVESPGLLVITEPVTFISYLIPATFTGVLWLECYTRMLVTKSSYDAKMAAGVSVIIAGIMMALVTSLGLGMTLIPEAMADPDAGLIWMVGEAGGTFFLFIIGIAIIAAEMSYIDSGVITGSVVFSRHIIGRGLKASEEQQLKYSKYFIMGILAAAFLLSQLSLPALFTISLFAGQILFNFFPIVVIGVLWKRVTTTACWAGIGVGVPISLILWFMPDLKTSLVGGWEPGMVGVAFNLLVFFIITLLSKQDSRVEKLFKEVERVDEKADPIEWAKESKIEA